MHPVRRRVCPATAMASRRGGATPRRCGPTVPVGTVREASMSTSLTESQRGELQESCGDQRKHMDHAGIGLDQVDERNSLALTLPHWFIFNCMVSKRSCRNLSQLMRGGFLFRIFQVDRELTSLLRQPAVCRLTGGKLDTGAVFTCGVFGKDVDSLVGH